MGLVLFVIGGAFVGWLAAAIEEVDEGVLARMGLGVLGAMLGGTLLAVVGGSTAFTQATWAGVIVAVVGAALLLGVVNLSVGYKSHGPNTT